MRCTLLTIFLLTLQCVASQAAVQSNIKVNKQNEIYYLLQEIDTDSLSPPKVKLVIIPGFVPTLMANLVIIGLTSQSEVFMNLLRQINIDLNKHNIDSILKEPLSSIVKESNLTIRKELSIDRFNREYAKIGDKVIQLNTRFIFHRKMNSIQVLVTLKIRRVKRFTNLGRKNQRPKYDVIYENKFKFISSILSENGGSKAIVEERKRQVNKLYKLELLKIEHLKSSKFKAQKKSRLNYAYRKNMEIISRLTKKTLKKEALTRLWAANNSTRVISTLKNASLELSRMIDIDLASYQEKRTNSSYKQLPAFTKKIGIIEQTEKRAIVINHSYRYCSLPLLATPKYCF